MSLISLDIDNVCAEGLNWNLKIGQNFSIILHMHYIHNNYYTDGIHAHVLYVHYTFLQTAKPYSIAI